MKSANVRSKSTKVKSVVASSETAEKRNDISDMKRFLKSADCDLNIMKLVKKQTSKKKKESADTSEVATLSLGDRCMNKTKFVTLRNERLEGYVQSRVNSGDNTIVLDFYHSATDDTPFYGEELGIKYEYDGNEVKRIVQLKLSEAEKKVMDMIDYGINDDALFQSTVESLKHYRAILQGVVLLLQINTERRLSEKNRMLLEESKLVREDSTLVFKDETPDVRKNIWKTKQTIKQKIDDVRKRIKEFDRITHMPLSLQDLFSHIPDDITRNILREILHIRANNDDILARPVHRRTTTQKVSGTSVGKTLAHDAIHIDATSVLHPYNTKATFLCEGFTFPSIVHYTKACQFYNRHDLVSDTDRIMYNTYFTSFTLEYLQRRETQTASSIQTYRPYAALSPKEIETLKSASFKRPSMWYTQHLDERYELKGLYARYTQNRFAREELLNTMERPLYVDGVRYTSLEKVRTVIRKGADISTVADIPPTNDRVRAMFDAMKISKVSETPISTDIVADESKYIKHPMLSNEDAIYVELLSSVLDEVEPDDESVTMKTINSYISDMYGARMDKCETEFDTIAKRAYGKSASAVFRFNRERMERYLYTYANSYLRYYLTNVAERLPNSEVLLTQFAERYPVYRDAVLRGDVLILSEAIYRMSRIKDMRRMKEQMQITNEMLQAEVETEAVEADRQMRLRRRKKQSEHLATLHKFKLIRVAGDGNCLYNAFLMSMYNQHKPPYGDEGVSLDLKRNVGVLRNAIADLLDLNPLPTDAYEGSDVVIPKSETLRQDGEWGGDLELALLSRIHGVDIRVQLKDGNYLTYLYEDTRKMYPKMPPSAKDYEKVRGTVYLAFTEVEGMRRTGHYDALVYDVTKSDEVIEYFYDSTTGGLYHKKSDGKLERVGVWNPLELTIEYDEISEEGVSSETLPAVEYETLRFNRFGEHLFYGVSSVGGF